MENQHRHIKGYRDLTKHEIELMNAVKAKAEEVRELLDRLASAPGIDDRALDLGRTNLQQGFMWTVRAIAQPETF